MNIKTEQRNVYITSDGQEFINASNANDHEQVLQVRRIVESFFYYNIDPESIVDGIIENKKSLSLILDGFV